MRFQPYELLSIGSSSHGVFILVCEFPLRFVVFRGRKSHFFLTKSLSCCANKRLYKQLYTTVIVLFRHGSSICSSHASSSSEVIPQSLHSYPTCSSLFRRARHFFYMQAIH